MATKSTPHYDGVELKFYDAPPFTDLTAAGAAYSQAEAQAVRDAINTLAAALRTAGVIASN